MKGLAATIQTYRNVGNMHENLVKIELVFLIIPAKARDCGITGVRLSVCLFVCLFVTTITK